MKNGSGRAQTESNLICRIIDNALVAGLMQTVPGHQPAASDKIEELVSADEVVETERHSTETGEGLSQPETFEAPQEYWAGERTNHWKPDVGGEYCFGQEGGCQNATEIDGEGFAVPIALPAGHLVELYGDISGSTFDGTKDYGPLPTGASWGSTNDFYLLPGGCGIFTENLNSQGFPNPAPLSTLHSWLPHDGLHLARTTWGRLHHSIANVTR